MKLVKIFTEILKMKEKDKSQANYAIKDGFIYYIPDGHKMFKIPKHEFLIDIPKVLPWKTPLDNVSRLMNDNNATLATKTNEIKVIANGKIQVVKIENSNSYAWVNVKYLEYFDDKVSYKIIDPKNPVFVYENDELVGLVLPVFIGEEV